MTISYKVSASLKQALAKAAALPREDQDEIAAMILRRIAGDEWSTPGARRPSLLASIGDLVDTVVPKHPVARTLTLTMGSFILFVQAPMALLMGVLTVAHELNAKPSGAMRISQVSVGGANHSSVRVPEARRDARTAEPVDDEQDGK